jgi:hypothetical protein
MKTIVKLIKRYGIGDFLVEDSAGDWYRVQMAYKLEEAWQAATTKAKLATARDRIRELELASK